MFCLYRFASSEYFTSGIIQYICIWLLPFTLMFLGFIPLVACISMYFVPFCCWMVLYPVDGHLDCSQFLTVVNNGAWTFEYKSLCGHRVPFSWVDIYRGIELLSHLFNFLRSCHTFLKWSLHFTFPAQQCRRVLVSSSLPTLVTACLFY